MGREEREFTTITLDNSANAVSTILTGLEESMSYQVKMLAFTDVGDSDFSDTNIGITWPSGWYNNYPGNTDIVQITHEIHVHRSN